MTSIIIPDSITSIDETVFNGTAWYDNQPDGLLYVGKVVYKYIGTLPKNTSVTLREDTLGITNYAFKNCSGLASITIPESVTSIGRDAFLGCSNLTSIYYTGDIESWCGISGLSTLMSESRTLYIDGNKVEGDLIIPDSVMSITNSAFAYCSGLTSVTIPNSTTSIGDSAFKACSSLTRISGSADNVRRIAWQANPNSFAIEITSGESIGDSAYKNCAGLRKVTISDSVTSVGYGAFEGCKDLTNISGLANNVSRIAQQANPNWFAIEITSGESIGDSAFNNCAGLRKVTISDSVTSIGRNAFGGTAWYNNKPDGLIYAGKVAYRYKGFMNRNTSITLREDTLGIASYAFYECSGLTSITIPNSVTNIGDFAFLRCPNLTNIYYTGDIASWCGISGLGWLMLMSESMTLYIDGNKLEGDLIIPDSVTSIGNQAFYGCTGLTSVTIPNSVTSIGLAAFSGCTGLTSITIPDSVTSIGFCAFENCSSLISITIPNSVTNVSSGAFGNTAWYNNQPDGLVYAGKVAYEYKGTMPSNTSIVIKDGTLGIVSAAFVSCSGLTIITIPNSVTRIGEEAFRYCDSLTSIEYDGTIEQWQAVQFGNDWDKGTGEYIVHCADGTVAKDGTVTKS